MTALPEPAGTGSTSRSWPAVTRWRDLRPAERRWAAFLAGILVAAGVAAVCIQRARGYALFGDEARLALESMRSVRDRPLLGVLTTAGEYTGRSVHNPGPIQLYTLFPFVRILGVDLGSAIYTALIVVGSVVLAGWAALRTGGRRAGLIVLLAAVAMVATTNVTALDQVLNDPLVLGPTFAGFVLAWAVATGDVVALPVLGVIVTYAVQTYVGSGVPLGFVTVTALALLAIGARRHGAPHRWKPALATTAGVLAVLWAPPLADQVRGQGNLAALLSLQIAGRGPRGAASAAQAVLDPIGVVHNVVQPMRGLPDPTPAGWVRVVVVGGLVAGCAVVLATTPVLRALVATAGAVFTAALVNGWIDPPDDVATYHFLWVGASAWWLAATTAILVASRVRVPSTWSRTTAARAAGCAAAVAMLLPLGVMLYAASIDPWRDLRSSAVRSITAQLDATLPPSSRWRALTLNGFIAGDIQRGVEAQVIAGGRTIDWGLYPDASASGSLVFVNRSSRITISGDLVASWPGRPSEHRSTAGAPDAVREFVAHHGGLRLTAAGRNRLPSMVDGTVPEVCVRDIAENPEALLRMDPGILAGLYAQDDVVAPTLPGELRDAVNDWFKSAPIDVYRLDDPHTSADFDISNLVFSRSSC